MRGMAPSHRGNPTSLSASALTRPALFSAAKLLAFGLLNLPFLGAAPTGRPGFSTAERLEPLPPHSPKLWIYLTVAVGLVLLGGAFAGLTIALMGQDEIYLQVIEKSGEEHEKRYAAGVLRLLKRGKHWVLVTLLLGNVITNETLPIVLDRSLGGGWPAVLGSTVLIVIFGEIIPQSICVRYGLPIGSWMSPLVLVLMYILAPVAWPTAKLLDRLLGEDHGTTYKKAGLKTLVTLHKTLGAAGEQLNSDEVTIISAVLDLKAKPVGSIMTPMGDVFTMSADTVLDEKTTDIILRAGYSRIPIHTPDNPENFVGMLLVKILITYDPEDCKRVRDFALATLPETRAETSCLDIVNFFQEGKSHMVLVSEFPGEDHGALGVVTLEDVIEELIGEEIIDESDVYIDVHRAIRRMAPAPKSRIPKGDFVDSLGKPQLDDDVNVIDGGEGNKAQHKSPRRIAMSEGDPSKENGVQHERESSSKTAPNLRRTSSTTAGSDWEGPPKRANVADMREHLKHLGPSNLASRPRQTRYNAVKIKPGGGVPPESPAPAQVTTPKSRTPPVPVAAQDGKDGATTNPAATDAKDGVLAVLSGYGTINANPKTRSNPQSPRTDRRGSQPRSPDKAPQTPTFRPSSSRTASHSTLGSLNNGSTSRPNSSKIKKSLTVSVARSGSITENIVDAGGIKKTVLEPSSSSEELIEHRSGPAYTLEEDEGKAADDERKERPGGEYGVGRKKRRRRKRKGGTDAAVDEGEGEGTPLLAGR